MYVYVVLWLFKSIFNIVCDWRDIYMYIWLWKNKIDEDDIYYE